MRVPVLASVIPWMRINFWLGIVSLLLGWSMWTHPVAADSCCCHRSDSVSSQCQCQPELCQCAPSDDDRSLVLLPVPDVALLSSTQTPQATPRLTTFTPVAALATFPVLVRPPEIQPRAPPVFLQS